MPKGHEDHRSGKKKAKLSLKEKRAQKREKKNRYSQPHDFETPQSEINY